MCPHSTESFASPISIAIPRYLSVITSCTAECPYIQCGSVNLEIRDNIAAEAPLLVRIDSILGGAKERRQVARHYVAEAVTAGSTWRWKRGQPLMRLAHSKPASEVGVPAILRTLLSWSKLKLRWETSGCELAN